jgi:hypothetical protein
MSRFTIGGGLYSPLEVEVDGQVFRVRKIGRAVGRQLDALQAEYDFAFKSVDDQDVRKIYATMDKVYAELMLLFDSEAKESIENLGFLEASELLKRLVSQSMNQDKPGDEPDPGKNVPKPGDVTAP